MSFICFPSLCLFPPDMSVNSSSPDSFLQSRLFNSSDFNLLRCLNYWIFPSFVVTNTVLLVPLCIAVLHHGLQRWRQQVPMTHSDSFTYHLVVIELTCVIGYISCYCGVYKNDLNIFFMGFYPITFTWYGETFFNLLTCVERYLAVIHPIIYLSLRKQRGTRIRNVITGCTWLLCFLCTCLQSVNEISSGLGLLLSVFSVIIISFCSLFVLCGLIHPGPGERGKNQKKRLDQSKLRAFCTITAILGVLLLRLTFNLVWVSQLVFKKRTNECVLTMFDAPRSSALSPSPTSSSSFLSPSSSYTPSPRTPSPTSSSSSRSASSSSARSPTMLLLQSASATTHSDSFTYNLVTMEIVSVVGCLICCCGIYRYHYHITHMGTYFLCFTWFGETFFQPLTCVEHYLAVVHPISYLSLRKEKWIKIRNLVTGCVWLLCFAGTFLVTVKSTSEILRICILVPCLIIITFCSLSVLCVLTRPGPGRQDRDGVRVDQSKLRAFYTIVVILGVLLLRSAWNLLLAALYMVNVENAGCVVFEPFSSLFTIFTVAITLVLVPLSIFVLYHGLQRRRQHRSSSMASTSSHSDTFTYHLVSMEIICVIGCIISCCGVLGKNFQLQFVGTHLFSFTWYGETFIHLLTCVEHYLAVVHPITYLNLRKRRGIRVRNIIVGFIWLLCCGGTSLITLDDVTVVLMLGFLIFSLIIISFCSLSVLCVLIRPGPEKQGKDRATVDQSKQRAFYAILAILGVLLLRCGWNVVWAVLYMSNSEINKCMVLMLEVWINLPSTLVLPLLFLQRAGVLACFKNVK
ncbi:hypothetical protein Q5P01_002774 [Channa striata]|uniref:G-protein coupled receptors family 1 profile domain-containing protein n=1 Tax=Channa striata TaxID=64152 RepID=A0AA88NN52_CHASR|nr:hypothetical protein Q5P01_002774 [Channa striata]